MAVVLLQTGGDIGNDAAVRAGHEADQLGWVGGRQGLCLIQNYRQECRGVEWSAEECRGEETREGECRGEERGGDGVLLERLTNHGEGRVDDVTAVSLRARRQETCNQEIIIRKISRVRKRTGCPRGYDGCGTAASSLPAQSGTP